MSIGTGVKGAINAIAVTAERSLGAHPEQNGIHPKLIEWCLQRGLREAHSQAVRRLKSEADFDSYERRVGVVWWPPLPMTHKVPVIVGLTFNDVHGFGVRVALFQLEEEKGDPHGIGMRFEGPHTESDDHNFHHAQLWTRLEKGEDKPPFVDVEAWEQQPSFPLRAGNPLDLVWAAAVSVYGREHAMKPFEADETERGKIARYIRGLS